VLGVRLARQMAVLRRGCAEIITEAELASRLEKAAREERPLRVKLGVDPTAPDIHLGHAVVLRKLREFQDLGHDVILVIGDFTGRVGDPSGKSETRPQLTEEDVKRNAKTYIDQVFKIIDSSRTVVDFNSRWLSKLTFADVIDIASRHTVARVLEREDFATRLDKNVPVYLHELMYPLMQGYDSVALRADVELGGTDQKFNLLMARQIQKEYGQEPEIAVLMPILEGTDGVSRMSKSAGNYIGVSEPPEEMYGKTMSIPDEVMFNYFELATELPVSEIESLRRKLKAGDLHPKELKMRLAREIVTLYHGAEAAAAAEEEFKRVFEEDELPGNIHAFEVDPGDLTERGTARVSRLAVWAGVASSSSEACRLITQGGVRVNDERITDRSAEVEVQDGMIIRVGKRKAARVRIKRNRGDRPSG